MADRLAALAVALPFVVGSVGGPAPDSDVVLRFRDPAIVESSGLVAARGTFATVNDSGDTGRVFLVGGDGTTIGVSTWSDDPVDVEALAPADAGHVWVGDIGDNQRARSTVEVVRVPLGRGDRTVDAHPRSLTYPDGSVDAEALLRHPRNGRLYVVSKEVLGGTVYAAPQQLRADRPNRLRAVASAPPIVTDGAFFPDGRHLVLRDYGRAFVYSFPSLERVAEVALADQQQGEGIAVDAGSRVYVSSEGRAAPVLEVSLPADLRRLVSGGPPSAPASPSSSAGDGAAEGASEGSSAEAESTSGDPVGSPAGWLPWALGGGLLVVVTVALAGVARRR